MGKVVIMDHPLVAHKLTIMRDKNTSVKDFRELVSEIGMLITYEATRDLPMTTKHIETPICEMDAPTLAGRKFVVVPILRAGLGLVDGVLRMVPAARVGHIGMYRDEETLEPHPYFCKMPKDVAERDVLIVDPMLATGGSAAEAIGEMKKRGCKHIKLMVLVAAPEGIKFLQEKHPDVDIYAGALDDHLNEKGYIVPGLGDAGDRIFGTKQICSFQDQDSLKREPMAPAFFHFLFALSNFLSPGRRFFLHFSPLSFTIGLQVHNCKARQLQRSAMRTG